MQDYVDQATCKATHKYDEADRAKLDEILVTVTETAQRQSDHNAAHKRGSVSFWNVLMGCIALGSLIAVVVFDMLKS